MDDEASRTPQAVPAVPAVQKNDEQRPVYIVLQTDLAAQPAQPPVHDPVLYGHPRPVPPSVHYPPQYQVPYYPAEQYPAPYPQHPASAQYAAPLPAPNYNQAAFYSASPPTHEHAKKNTSVTIVSKTATDKKKNDPDQHLGTFKVWSWLNLLLNPCAYYCSLIAFIASHMTEVYNESKNYKKARSKSNLAVGCNICALMCYIFSIGSVAGGVYAFVQYALPMVTSLMDQINSGKSAIDQISSGQLPSGVTIPSSVG